MVAFVVDDALDAAAAAALDSNRSFRSLLEKEDFLRLFLNVDVDLLVLLLLLSTSPCLVLLLLIVLRDAAVAIDGEQYVVGSHLDGTFFANVVVVVAV